MTALFLASALHSSAIENLTLSLQCSNVVLSWPSVPGDTYIIRYRPDLTTNSAWTVLADLYPASVGTNTLFVHSNIVLHPNCGGAGGGSSDGSGDGGPPAPMAMTFSGSSQASVQDATLADTADMNPDDLPYPWNPKFQSPDQPQVSTVAMTSVGTISQDVTDSGTPSPDGLSGSGQDMGFYEVVKDGVHLFGITNGMVLSGQVPLGVEFSNPDTNGILTSVFLLDTNADDTIAGSFFPTPTNSINGIWDTTQIPNGNYPVELGATLDDATFYLDHPVTVTVSNLVWTPDAWTQAGFGIYVGVQTVWTNGGTFQLDIYDDQTNHLGFLNGIIGSDGYLDYPGIPGPGFSLNNSDGSGNQLPSTFYTLTYAITPNATGTQPLGLTPPYNFTNVATTESNWNFAPTAATVVYKELFTGNTTLGQTQEHDLMLQISDIEVGAGGHPATLGDPTSGMVWTMPINGTFTDLVGLGLKSSNNRDFVYMGHGSPDAIGVISDSLYADAVALQLVNHNSYPFPKGFPPTFTYPPDRHPYRFVFLDGCDTAEGTWPLAFSIPKQSGLTINDFVNKRGLRPRAFVGWNKSKVFAWTFNSTVMDPDHLNFIETFWNSWGSQTNGVFTPLSVALQAAATAAPAAKKGRVIYGATDLTIGQ